MLTEDEARSKWCPFARLLSVKNKDGRLVAGAETAFNRVAIEGEATARLDAATGCIASACMAWQWSLIHRVIPVSAEDADKWRRRGYVEIEGDVNSFGHINMLAPKKDHRGQCGLAGKDGA